MRWFSDWWLRNYPYTNFHDMNDNWILGKLKQFETVLKKFGELLEKMSDEVADNVNKIVNQLIKDGTLYVAMEYNEETEEINIILTESDGGNNG